MLWPLLVEYQEPGIPLSSQIQQQGNMALFLILFVFTCVEVLLVKVAQSERELEYIFAPHDPPYFSQSGDFEEDDEDYDICRVRAELYEEEFHRQKKYIIGNSYMNGASASNLIESRKENDFEGTLCTQLQESSSKTLQKNDETQDEQSDLQNKEESTQKEDITKDTVQVREFIEKMVESIVGGPLDGITVGKLSNHSAYLAIFTKYHSLLCQELARLGFALHLSDFHKNSRNFESSNSANSNLKRLIKRIVSEAMALPNIKEILCTSEPAKEEAHDSFESKSYEDILATAILNKVIEKFQNKKEREKMNIGQKHCRRREKLKRNGNDDELLSSSDWSDSSRSDKLSLTIEEYIEEVTTAFEGSDDERSELSDYETFKHHRIPFPESGRVLRDAESEDENSENEEQGSATELITSTSSWEENWLFQKKRLRTTPNAHHPVPVPMLVPNPSEDYRALVGGVDADDLSDISDSSDLILEDIAFTESNNRLIKEHIAQNPETINGDDKIRSRPPLLLPSDKNKEEEETKTAIIIDKEMNNSSDAPETDSFNLEDVKEPQSVSSTATSPEILSQKDRELSVEDFELLHQFETISSRKPSLGNTNDSSVGVSNEENILRCRIAEREKEKWNNPVVLTDNPYSIENIEKREQKNKMEYFRLGSYTQDSIDFPEDLSPDEFAPGKSETLRFSRDYYVNASKHPSGSSSPASLYQGNEDFSPREPKVITPDTFKEFAVFEMHDSYDHGSPAKSFNEGKYCLPSVKELAKQFTGEPKTQSMEGISKSENKQKLLATSHASNEREPEIDYSSIPISEIVKSLQHASESLPPKHNKNDLHLNLQLPTQILRLNSNRDISNTEKVTKTAEGIETVRFNGKQVHSLTARSISKEFREGLKNHSYQKNFAKMDRVSSGGESDQGEIISNDKSISPTPSVDLQNMKKFWEGIITANSNTTKQK